MSEFIDRLIDEKRPLIDLANSVVAKAFSATPEHYMQTLATNFTQAAELRAKIGDDGEFKAFAAGIMHGLDMLFGAVSEASAKAPLMPVGLATGGVAAFATTRIKALLASLMEIELGASLTEVDGQ